ncbi:hypothetical protein Tco_1467747, partial [Tanacetum coccineum]
GDVGRLHDDFLRLETSLKYCLGSCGVAGSLEPKKKTWSFCNQVVSRIFRIGKITVVTLVRELCPHGKGKELIEQRFAAMVGYRKKKWGLKGDVGSLHDDLIRLETSLKCCLGSCGAAGRLEPKDKMWSFCNQVVSYIFRRGACKLVRSEVGGLWR